jgi:hypothetical protein
MLHKVCVHKILGTYTVEGETQTTRSNEDILLLEPSTNKFRGDR